VKSYRPGPWCLAKGDTRSDILDFRPTFPGGAYWSISRGYATREELIEGENIQPEPCCECGQVFGTHYDKGLSNRLVANKTCFTCDFWRGHVHNASNPKSLRIEGQHYWLGAGGGDSRWRGHGGREFTIRRLSGELVVTTDLWHQGIIPPHFRERLPDNAAFVQIPKPIGHGQGFLG
jgi:hypothetical protein